VFDILVRILGTDGKEATTALGTVRSGASFDLDIRFEAGEAVVTVDGAGGVRRTGRTPHQGRTSARSTSSSAITCRRAIP
jgi:hypothetical protein